MPVCKVIQLVASSDVSFEDAAQQGLARAVKTIRGISTVKVTDWTVEVENNAVAGYRVTLDVAFALED